MIALFTDFGSAGPYVGQLHAVLAMTAPGIPVVDLLHDIPQYNVRAAAYLLPAYSALFPPRTVFVCVVDPGVGSERRPLVLEADGKSYVGPDNGLFNLVLRRTQQPRVSEISWRPPTLSASFHARDLFAPVAAALAQGVPHASQPVTLGQVDREEWPDDLAQVVYIDRYGNGITGVRSSQLPIDCILHVRGRAVPHAGIYGDVAPGQAFWYGNSNGLVEIAVNRGSAQCVLGLEIGDKFIW